MQAPAYQYAAQKDPSSVQFSKNSLSWLSLGIINVFLILHP